MKNLVANIGIAITASASNYANSAPATIRLSTAEGCTYFDHSGTPMKATLDRAAQANVRMALFQDQVY